MTTLQQVESSPQIGPWQTRHGLTTRLMSLYQEGLSARETANTLSTEFKLSITRNQVIGKWHRLDLPRRELRSPGRIRKVGTTKKSRDEPRSRSRRSIPLPVPNMVLTPLQPKLELARQQLRVSNLPLLMLEPKGCKFPVGEYPFQFCCRPRLEGFPYCAGHVSLSYQPWKDEL